MIRLGHLTEQHKHFVEAYCRLGNGTLAAKEAGYKDSLLQNLRQRLNAWLVLKKRIAMSIVGEKINIREV